MWFVVWCLYVMVFGPFPKSKKAKAKAYCCVSNHKPHSQFAPLPDTLVHHVSMDEKYGFEKARSEAFHMYGCFVYRYRCLVFKGCDDHILNLVHAEFNRRIIQLSKDAPSYEYLREATQLGNEYATAYLLLKKVSRRLVTIKRPEWNALRNDVVKEIGKPPAPCIRFTKCSFGHFATFGASAGAQVWAGTRNYPLLTTLFATAERAPGLGGLC